MSGAFKADYPATNVSKIADRIRSSSRGQGASPLIGDTTPAPFLDEDHRAANTLPAGLPIPCRRAVAPMPTATAPMAKPAPAPMMGLPIASRKTQGQEDQKPLLPIRKPASYIMETITTPLKRASRRGEAESDKRPPASRSRLPRWARSTSFGCVAPGSSGPRPGSEEPESRSSPRSAPRTSSIGSIGSFRWAPEALVQHWHRRLLEHYEILNTVGEGRSGAVYIVQHRRTGKNYACKLLVKADHEPKALRNEIDTMRRLDHPNVVRLYETNEDSDAISLLMEYCRGGDLYWTIRREGRLDEATARVFARQMLSALSYCHARGVVHRDVKPENFLLESDDPKCQILKLADFGIATSIRPPHISSAIDGRQLSGSTGSWPSFCDGDLNGEFRGSAPYMAPEMWEHRWQSLVELDDFRECPRVLASSDLWSCGVVLYLMLSGQLPFGEDPEDIERICGTQSVDFSGDVWKHVSEEAIDLTRRLLVPSPQARCTAQQALAHEWFRGSTTPPACQRNDTVQAVDRCRSLLVGAAAATPAAATAAAESPRAGSPRSVAGMLLRSLRCWRQLPKLHRTVVTAMARQLDGEHEVNRRAQTVQELFGDESGTLTCDHLVQALADALGPCAVDAQSASSGDGITSAQLSARSLFSNAVHGFHMPWRVRNAVGWLAGSPGSARAAAGETPSSCTPNSVVALPWSPCAASPSPESSAFLAELRNLVDSLDSTKNGIVDHTLLVASLIPAEVWSDEAQIQEAFELFDVKKRGAISADDFRVVVGRRDADIGRFKAMIAEFDQDGNGRLDLDEFRSMVRAPHTGQPHVSIVSL